MTAWKWNNEKAANLLIAVLLPPISVYMTNGVGRPLYLDTILTLLAYFPGALYAVYLVIQKNKID